MMFFPRNNWSEAPAIGKNWKRRSCLSSQSWYKKVPLSLPKLFIGRKKNWMKENWNKIQAQQQHINIGIWFAYYVPFHSYIFKHIFVLPLPNLFHWEKFIYAKTHMFKIRHISMCAWVDHGFSIPTVIWVKKLNTDFPIRIVRWRT